MEEKPKQGKEEKAVCKQGVSHVREKVGKGLLGLATRRSLVVVKVWLKDTNDWIERQSISVNSHPTNRWVFFFFLIYMYFFLIAKSVDICCRWFGIKMQKPNQYHCTCHPDHLILEYFHLLHIYSHTHTETMNVSTVCFFHLTYEYYMSLKITW